MAALPPEAGIRLESVNMSASDPNRALVEHIYIGGVVGGLDVRPKTQVQVEEYQQ